MIINIFRLRERQLTNHVDVCVCSCGEVKKYVLSWKCENICVRIRFECATNERTSKSMFFLVFRVY